MILTSSNVCFQTINNFTKTITMYDNPEIVPDPLRGYADTLEQYTSILQAHADKKYGAYVIHYPKGGVEPTGFNWTPSLIDFGNVQPVIDGSFTNPTQLSHFLSAFIPVKYLPYIKDRHPETGEELDLIN